MENNNGYDKLNGDWFTYYKIGNGFTSKVKPEDREDFLHDLFLAFARVKARYGKGKELTIGGLVRIAQYEVKDYWRKYYLRLNGVECGHCSKAQKAKCKEWNYTAGDCPKAIRMESLDKLVEDGEGDSTPLYELIADDNADFIPRLDARLILKSYPIRFVKLAYKKQAGYSLDNKDAVYYHKQLKKAQKKLV